MQKSIITIVAISALLTGCSSLSEFTAKNRASYDDSYNKVMTESAMEYAQKFCALTLNKEQQSVSFKSCIKQEYDNRLKLSLVSETKKQNQQKIYSEDECIGAVVNGECRGTILPKPGYHETCYGQMIFGECTGPQF